MKYIEQLTAYYEAQGMAGEQLANAVEQDKARVIANVSAQGSNPESFINKGDDLACLFTWAESEEGHDYWFNRQ